jgi:ketosteroid isomerase-like protein
MWPTKLMQLFPLALAILVTAAPPGDRALPASAIDLRPQVEKYWHDWQSGPDAAAPLYAKDADLVFYDIVPLKYTGWASYQAGVGPNLLAKFERVTFTVHDDVKTTTHGEIAWTTATVDGNGVLKDGSAVHVVMRHTAIWQKRGTDWLIVHEHVSTPGLHPTQ